MQAQPANPLPLDTTRIRALFPALHQQVHGKPLVYLDSAATAQKPESVITAIDRYYREDNANVHRGVHTLSERATAAFESARDKLRVFINAASTQEIIFVRGATEAINLVATSYGTDFRAGDEILVSEMEHHSNIVPWQLLAQRSGASVRVIPINDAGELRMDELARLLSERTRLVAVTHCSNALGTINPIREICAMAHGVGAVVLVDGAQAAAHLPVDVQSLGCDFYALSGHKLYGPTGVGVLYGRRTLLEAMPPYHGGGEMIKFVTFEETQYNDLPYKFEAGTPDISGVIGLGAAVDFLNALGFEAIMAHEKDLLEDATRRARQTPGMRLIGTAANKCCILSFELEGIHPHDLGTVFDSEGVAIRAGHHCAMPVMQRYGVPATARASFALYNNRSDIDALYAAVHKAQELFHR